MKHALSEIRALTGIRGIAALWVVLYHNHMMDGIGGAAGRLLTHGYLAVDLFFVLSGFIMALSYAHFVRAGWSGRSYAIFLLRRLARIYPLYIATTLFIAATILLGFSHAFPLEGFGRVLLANILLIQSWGLEGSINGYAWSISTEFGAYLLFPLLTWVMLERRWGWALLATLGCMALVAYISILPAPFGQLHRMGPLDVVWHDTPWPSLRCLSEFCLGLGTYRMAGYAPARDMAARPAFALCLTVLLLLLLTRSYTDVLVVACLPPLILSLAVGKGLITRLCASRVVFFLGEISFSLYLLHSQFLRVRRFAGAMLEKFLPAPLADGLALLVLYASLVLCSWLAYRFLERPARNFLRRAEGLLGPAPRAA